MTSHSEGRDKPDSGKILPNNQISDRVPFSHINIWIMALGDWLIPFTLCMFLTARVSRLRHYPQHADEADVQADQPGKRAKCCPGGTSFYEIRAE